MNFVSFRTNGWSLQKKFFATGKKFVAMNEIDEMLFSCIFEWKTSLICFVVHRGLKNLNQKFQLLKASELGSFL